MGVRENKVVYVCRTYVLLDQQNPIDVLGDRERLDVFADGNERALQ
jgi:hypothetical protein